MNSQRFLRMICALLLAGLALVPATAQELWTKQYKNAANNAVQNQPAQLLGFGGGLPAWQTGDQTLRGTTGIVFFGGTYYGVAQDDKGNFDTSDDVVTVKAFNAESGHRLWESPPLDCGNTVSYWSTSTPTLDPAAGALFIATGSSVQKLDARTGALLTSVTLSAANTAPGAGYEFINSAPTLGGGRVFVETYSSYGFPGDKQLVALSADTLHVDWFQHDGGPGQASPVYVDNGTSQCVFTATTTGVNCYNAADGKLFWQSSAHPTHPWSTSDEIAASLVYDQGHIYAVTMPWGLMGQLVCLDAASGAKQWSTAAPSSSSAPLVLAGRIFISGVDETNSGLLQAFDVQYLLNDGSYHVATALTLATAVSGWGNNLLAAAGDRLYMSDDDKLLIFNPATQETFAAPASVAGGYTGPVMLDARGGVYVHSGGGITAFGQTVPVVLSDFSVE